MPSANRFAFVRDTVRNHPVIVASWAATAGILLGGFVTLKVHGSRSRAPAKIGTAQAAAEAKAGAEARRGDHRLGAERGESVASTDCDKQTWPYLSRACMEAMRGKEPRRRAWSRPTSSTSRRSVRSKSAPTPAPPAEQTPSLPIRRRVRAVRRVALTPAALAESAPAIAAQPRSLRRSHAAPRCGKRRPRKSRHRRRIRKRRSRKSTSASQRRPSASRSSTPRQSRKRSPRNDRMTTTATSPAPTADDRPSDGRIARGRADRRRIVERWTERDYNVPSTMAAATGASR